MPIGYFPRNNRAGELLGQGLSAFGQNFMAARQNRDERKIRDEDRARATALQDYELGQRGVHLTKPGELPPSSVFENITNDAVRAGTSGRSALMPGDQAPGSVRPSASFDERAPQSEFQRLLASAMPSGGVPARPRYEFGNGFYVDNEVPAANAARASAAEGQSAFQKALLGALPGVMTKEMDRGRTRDANRRAGVPENMLDATVENPQLADNILFPTNAGDNSEIKETDKGYVSIDKKTHKVTPLGIQGYHAPRDEMMDFRRMNQVSSLRGQFNQDASFKQAQDITSAYSKIRMAATGKHTATSDMSIVYGLMKMQDPGSTVREGEYATAENAAGIPARLRDAYNLTLKQHLLPDETRQQFLSTAEQLARAHRQAFKGTMQRYSDIAGRSGIDSQDVVFDPFTTVFDDRQEIVDELGKKGMTDAQIKMELKRRGY